jgi:glucosamine--fructose-6-phosphate aminotransferase (isomerizing)
VLNLFVDEEESVTTRTYLATIAVNYILASYLSGKDLGIVKKELYSTMDVLENFVEVYRDKAEEYYDFIKDVSFVSTIGKGYSLSSSLASGLFFKEVSKFPSEGMDLSEFRHGPVEIVDDKFGCIVYAPEGVAVKIVINTALQIAKRGGKVVLITNSSDVTACDNMILMQYGKINEKLSPIIDIAGAQFICNILAEKRNFVPGKFMWSSKITKGE